MPHVMKCQACGSTFSRLHIEYGAPSHSWFWGEAECPKCGRQRIGGTKTKIHQITHWHPACIECGLDTVIALNRDCTRFQCTECGVELRVIERKIMTVLAALEPQLAVAGGAA